jgi:DNA-binding MarR family transcriptional regulator
LKYFIVKINGGFMIKNFGKVMSKLSSAFVREMTSRAGGLFSKGECVPSHIVVLAFLAETGESSMKTIANALSLTMGAATAIIDRMVEMKIVSRKRDNNDRRVVMVFSLKKGKEFYEKLCVSKEKVLNEMFSILTDKEQVEYIRLFTKVVQNAKT